MITTFHWKKAALILSSILLILVFLPNKPIDPWNLINLKKITTIIFTLSLLQLAGSFLMYKLGHTIGAILSGFLGGLASSTATTASLAQQSRTLRTTQTDCCSGETLTFLAATLAMLFECILITTFGSGFFRPSFLIIFSGPSLYVLYSIWNISRSTLKTKTDIDTIQFEIQPILKLTAFIVIILSLSKLIQRFIGDSALLALTFVVSLFEVHGTVIANMELLDTGIFSIQFLGSLLCVSISATFVSKLILVRSLGSAQLTQKIFQHTSFLFLSLLASWLLFILNQQQRF